MPIKDYGVWVGKPVRVSAERTGDDPESPHIHLYYQDGNDGRFRDSRRASINVRSQSAISELVYWVVRDFSHPVLDELRPLSRGFHPLKSAPGGAALDYIRGNLLELSSGRILPHDLPGEHDDIIDFVMPDLEAAIRRKATVYLFGEPYRDGQGIHTIHMNQGSVGRFRGSNGVWQDGAVIIHYPTEDRYDAIFLAFASQSVHTDERTGHGLRGSQSLAQLLKQPNQPAAPVVPVSPEIPDDIRVAIIAALVNPVGAENQPDPVGREETVYLLNRTNTPISLRGWTILNQMDDAQEIEGPVMLEPGEVQTFHVPNAPLSNSGGLISLLDERGNKVDGVSYTRAQARKEGEIVIFR